MKKYLAIALALIMMLAVFAIPTAAAVEGAQAPLAAYEMLMGTELSHQLFNDPWDWTTSDGPNNPNWNNFSADGAYPAVRIQTINVPADQTFEAGEQISINWILVKGNLHQALCLNYDLGTGIVSGANGDFLSIVDYSAPVAEKTGTIQFITTITYDGATAVEKTYANGVLVLQRHTHDGAGATICAGVQYSFYCMNNDGTGFSGASSAYMDKGVETVNFLYWSSNTVTASDSLVAGIYNSYARYYDKDVVLYPQVEKNGLVVGKGGIRYYVNGVAQTGFVDGRYFLKETGYMAAASEKMYIGGAPYSVAADGKVAAIDGADGNFYFQDGAKVKGWLDEAHYYYLETGVKCTTSRKIGGIYYTYTRATDTLAKTNDFLDEGDDTFYLVDGVKAKGWQNIDGDWYYFYKETGVLVYDDTITIGGVSHTFDGDGVCADYAE